MILQIVEKGFNPETGAVQYQPTKWFYNTANGTSSDSGLSFSPVSSINESDYFVVAKGATTFYGRTSNAEIILDGTADATVTVDSTTTILPAATFEDVLDFINQAAANKEVGGIFTGYGAGTNKYKFTCILSFPLVIVINSNAITYS